MQDFFFPWQYFYNVILSVLMKKSTLCTSTNGSITTENPQKTKQSKMRVCLDFPNYQFGPCTLKFDFLIDNSENTLTISGGTCHKWSPLHAKTTP